MPNYRAIAAPPSGAWVELSSWFFQCSGIPREDRRFLDRNYLAYRRAGGVSQSNQAQFFVLVGQAIQQNSEVEAQQQVNSLLERSAQPHFIALIRQLQRVLAGDRNPGLAEDPELDYRNAAELQLLLESLTAG